LRARGLSSGARTVPNLLDRDDERRAVSLTDDNRLGQLLTKQRRRLLALDGLQPDVGHALLWVLRDCLSGEGLLARSLRSARPEDRAALIATVRGRLPVPVAGVVAAGPHSTRKAVAQALPGGPPQRGPFPYWRAAARPLDEAERHARKERTKRLRGVRGLERPVAARADPEAEALRGYGRAVPSAWTDDGRPPLDASG
jgi:hypothetical protein